jgi:type I restriction enzyme S subunit
VRRYPQYEDSGVPSIGRIPCHWRIAPLKYLVRLESGGTPGKDNDRYWRGDVPWASAKDLKSDLLRSTEDHLSSWALEDGAASLVPRGATLVVVRGMILARTFPVVETAIETAINQDLKAVIANRELAADFLPWLLRGMAEESLRRLDEAGHGTKALRMDAWTSMQCPVPPVPEQKAISEFLRNQTATIDTLIAEQEKLIALLAEKRQATISHAVTRGLDPEVPMRDSGVPWLGDVPAHWCVLPLKLIVSTPITDGPHETPTFLDDGVPFVSAEAVSGGVVNFDKIRGYISESDHRRYSLKYKPQVGDIYMIKSGATTGMTAIVEEDCEFNIWSPLAAIRCNRDRADPRFVLYALRSRNFQESVTLHWTFGTQQNIGMGSLGDLPIALPPIAEQWEIAGHLLDDESVLKTLGVEAEAAIELLRERRAALITAAVTGQIDVRDSAARQNPATEDAPA